MWKLKRKDFCESFPKKSFENLVRVVVRDAQVGDFSSSFLISKT